MNGFSDVYDVILFDEFSLGSLPRSVLWRLMQHLMVGLPQKHGQDIMYTRKVPIIFISNFSPPDDPSFYRRITYYFWSAHEPECAYCVV